MLKIAGLGLLALSLAPLAQASPGFPNYFGQGHTYKLAKGGASCPSQLYLDAFPSTGLRIDGQGIGRVVFISDLFGTAGNPFGSGGTALNGTDEVRTEPCNRAGVNCSGDVRTDERTTIFLNEDFKKLAIEKKTMRWSTGGFLSSKVDETVIYKCQFRQVR